MGTLWNRSDKEVAGHVDGTGIIVPPKGSIQVADRYAAEMARKHPDELSLNKPDAYSAEQIAHAQTLPAAELAALVEKLMRGEIPTVTVPAAEPKAEAKAGKK